MIASKKRTLLPGTAYGLLIPPSAGKTQVLRNSANTDHTIETVKSVVRSTLEQTARLATELKGRDLRGTCSKIWHFVYQHIQYRNDDAGYEQVRHPARIWADRRRGVDCDDYSVFISSILLNLGIPHKLRVTDYGRGWQHIYVVVPKSGRLASTLDQQQRDDYIVIDCVPNDFDYEVRYTRKMDIPMQLQVLSGLDGVHGPDYGIDGYDPNNPELGNIFKKIGGAIQKGVQAVKKAGDAVAKVAKKVVASPARAGVLVWMKLNIKQAASKLRWGYLPYGQKVADAGYGPKAHEQIVNGLRKLQKTYVDLGGRADALRGAILHSPGNKDRAVPVDAADLAGLGELATTDPDWQVMQQVNSLDSKVSPELFGYEGLNAEPISSTALITAATAIVVPIINLIAKAKANDPSDPVPDQYLPEEEQSDQEAAAAVDVEPTQPDPAVEGLGAVAKKKAKKVAAVVAKKKPALVAKATAKVVQKAGAKPAGKVVKTAVKLATKAAVKPAAKTAAKAVKTGVVATAAVATGAAAAVKAGARPAAKAAAKAAIKPIVKPAAKPPVATKAQKKAVVKAAVGAKKKSIATGVKVAAGAAAATAIAPIVARPIVVPDSSLTTLPVSLPTVTDESGTEQVVMPRVDSPTAPAATTATKKQGLIARIFKRKQDKTGSAKPAATAAKPAKVAKSAPAAKPATNRPAVTARPTAAPAADTDESDYDSNASVSADQVSEAITQTSAAAADLVKQKKVAAVIRKTGKVSAAVQQVVKAATDKTAADDAMMVDATAETEAQANADVDNSVSIPDGTPAPKQAGFFSTADGKTDWVKVGIAGAGAYVLSQLLLGDESAASHPRPPRSKSKGLSGTGKKASRKRSKSLAGLEAVPLS